jgi:AhpD family alkylhydroperoxidase
MALIKTISPDQATGKVAEIYQHFQGKFGFIPNGFQLTSSSEFLLSQQVANISYYMQHPVLTAPLQAFIRMLVSVGQNCAYCITMNTGLLMQGGFSLEQIQAAQANPEMAPLEEKEKGLLLFVLKAVKDAHSISAQDVDHLRQLGWEDQHILEATFHGTSQVATDMIFNAFKLEAN